MFLKHSNSIYHFLILFLTALLLMFVMHYVLASYHSRAVSSGGIPLVDLSHLFRVNLFIINLCLILIVEILLIVLFCRYTVPSVTISSIFIVIFLMFREAPPIRVAITNVFSPLIANRYAYLDSTDAIFLLVLNIITLSFIITVILNENIEVRYRDKTHADSNERNKNNDQH